MSKPKSVTVEFVLHEEGEERLRNINNNRMNLTNLFLREGFRAKYLKCCSEYNSKQSKKRQKERAEERTNL